MTQPEYYAKLDWEDSIPISTRFDDRYFSKASGIAEAKYVFLEHNYLTKRFAALNTDACFVIGETGFGCGLNFLTTIQLWRTTNQNSTTKLHYLSIEKYPLNPDDLIKIISNFPELNPELNSDTKKLIEQYYLLLPGWHRISFAPNIELTLIIADIYEALSELNFPVDAWFLDGFSPTKNPEMWHLKVLANLARLSHPSTTFATYTANSQVRRDLVTHGFTVFKTKGFANKRDVLYGQFKRITATLQKIPKPRNYYQRPNHQAMLQQNRMLPTQLPLITDKRVAIIGAGISGAATAYSLAKRGFMVTVYEQNPAPAMEASGNYQGMLYGTWSAFDNPSMELSYSAYRYSHYLIERLLEPGKDYNKSGLIQLGHNVQQIKRDQQLLAANLPEDFIQFINHDQIEKIAGIKLAKPMDGIYFPHGLWLKPSQLVNKLLDHPNIKLVFNCKITNFEYIEQQTWQLYNETQQIIDQVNYLVVCNAYLATKFKQLNTLNLRKIGGQTSIVKYSNEYNGVKTVLCGKGYITPSSNEGKFTIGATFNFNCETKRVTIADHHKNLNLFQDILPELIAKINLSELEGKTSIRTSSYDYLPLAGPIAKYKEFNADFAKLRQDKNAWIKQSCQYYCGLYLNLAHGAKGFLTAPYSGEIIADYIDNTPLPCSEKLRQALHPNRLYVKELVKPSGR